ncbi:MAG: peroxidase family protein [Vicinamibacterales bacterium]
MSDGDRASGQDAGGTPAPTVSDLLQMAALLSVGSSGPESASQAIKALEQAFELDPTDGTGAICARLGRLYFLQERYGDAVRHLEAAVIKQPDDKELADVLERAGRNCETRIERAMSIIEFTDPIKMTGPPALYLRPPGIRAPLPAARRHPWRHSAPVVALQTIAGGAAGVVVSAALAITRRVGLNDETRQAWIRRPRIPGQLSLAAYREWLNGHVIQDPYRHGDLTANQPAGQKRPAWTRTMPTANGSWRTDDPMEGAALARYAQQGAQPMERYQSRLNDPRLPSPREVARAFLHLKPGASQTLAPFLNALYIAWIQFQSHDWFSHGENVAGSGMYRIPLAPDDPIRVKHGLEALEIKRTQPDPHPSGGLLTYPNEVTHWWDGSQLYGSNQETEDRVRTGADGRLLAGGKLYLPQNLLPISPATGIEDSGFTRNWWLGLSMFHTLFARHHNRICDELTREYPDHPWTSDQLFKTARLVNAAVMAKIHTVEWTPAVLPNKTVAPGLCVNWWGLAETRLRPYRKRRIQRIAKLRHPIVGGLVGGRRDNHGVRHQFSEEFVSAYRLHEGLTERIGIRYVGDPEARTYISTDATRGQAAHRLVQTHGLGNLFNSFGLEKGGALVNNNLPGWITDMSIDGHAVIDIGTIDILRDRERGVPGYNDLRNLQGLPRLKTYDDLAVDSETKANLERLYGPAPQGLDIMDLQVGMLCDRGRPEGFAFDDLRFAFFIKAASSRLEEDPMFCENMTPEVYTEWGLDHIDAMDLREVLLLECPELSGAPLARSNARGRYTLGNSFEPWGTTAETHPDEHPLTAKRIERY